MQVALDVRHIGTLKELIRQAAICVFLLAFVFEEFCDCFEVEGGHHGVVLLFGIACPCKEEVSIAECGKAIGKCPLAALKVSLGFVECSRSFFAISDVGFER